MASPPGKRPCVRDPPSSWVPVVAAPAPAALPSLPPTLPPTLPSLLPTPLLPPPTQPPTQPPPTQPPLLPPHIEPVESVRVGFPSHLGMMCAEGGLRAVLDRAKAEGRSSWL